MVTIDTTGTTAAYTSMEKTTTVPELTSRSEIDETGIELNRETFGWGSTSLTTFSTLRQTLSSDCYGINSAWPENSSAIVLKSQGTTTQFINENPTTEDGSKLYPCASDIYIPEHSTNIAAIAAGAAGGIVALTMIVIIGTYRRKRKLEVNESRSRSIPNQVKLESDVYIAMEEGIAIKSEVDSEIKVEVQDMTVTEQIVKGAKKKPMPGRIWGTR
ncbi:hypothetical protein BCR33DRAFT_306479 [Rhizoclosmatium globosum]|uniref:Uncharacterized protein n=1 Tax=Rhizoclosmatium globosum TaxID=329046 RepID=A0A1Y2C5D6_9FUNG|nr:hypothetical protein BCR33DRAFT_306479 [Rhizoclosmatium globosum]|eukprot:ORY42241.1 hypothetical protein BCR33DRAFT_306479 [Rhizoclosmatium globosum]